LPFGLISPPMLNHLPPHLPRSVAAIQRSSECFCTLACHSPAILHIRLLGIFHLLFFYPGAEGLPSMKSLARPPTFFPFVARFLRSSPSTLWPLPKAFNTVYRETTLHPPLLHVFPLLSFFLLDIMPCLRRFLLVVLFLFHCVDSPSDSCWADPLECIASLPLSFPLPHVSPASLLHVFVTRIFQGFFFNEVKLNTWPLDRPLLIRAYPCP